MFIAEIMSNRSSRVSSRFTEAEINELIFKLQALLPDASTRCNSRVPASKILTDTCNYIKQLHKELDDLSDRLSQLLPSGEINDMDHEEIIRRLLQQ